MTIIDTNVLISFVLSTASPILNIRDAWLSGKFQMAVSRELVAECERVSNYAHLKKFFKGDEREKRIAELNAFSTLLVIEPPYPKSPDPDDDFLLAMLELPETEALVTGDKKLLALSAFEGKEIISPAAFAAKLAASNQD